MESNGPVAAGQLMESAIRNRGSVFALWGRDEKVEGEEGDGGLGTAQPIIHAILLFDGGLPSLMETKLFLQEKLLPHKRLAVACRGGQNGGRGFRRVSWKSGFATLPSAGQGHHCRPRSYLITNRLDLGTNNLPPLAMPHHFRLH